MQRDLGRRRLAATTAVVGAGAVAVAALVGFTRPTPVHHAARLGAGDTHHRHHVRAGGPSSTDQPPDAVSSGS